MCTIPTVCNSFISKEANDLTPMSIFYFALCKFCHYLYFLSSTSGPRFPVHCNTNTRISYGQMGRIYCIRMLLSISKPLFDFSRFNVFYKVSPPAVLTHPLISQTCCTPARGERPKCDWRREFFWDRNIRSIHKGGRRSGLRRSSLEWLPVLTTVTQKPHNSKIFQNSWDSGINWGYIVPFMVQWLTLQPLLKLPCPSFPPATKRNA